MSWVNYQQNQQKNVDNEEMLKRRYQNTRSNAKGQRFEREIIAGCKSYEQYGIAIVNKTPEPFKVTTKNHKNGEFTGRFVSHAQPDFQGTLVGGKSIVFEAKRTDKDRMLQRALTDTQMNMLYEHEKLGAISAVCACIGDNVFFIPFSVWRNMKSDFGRKYITADDVRQFQVRFDGTVHFLDKIEINNRRVSWKV